MAVLSTVAVWALAGASPASGEVQAVAGLGARVDWATGEVRITVAVPAPKKSKPDALKASALALAQGNLKKLFAQLKGGGGTYAIPGDPAKVASLVKGGKIASSGAAASGRYQVVFSVCLPKASGEGEAPEAPEAALAPARRAYKDPDSSQVRTFPAPPPTGEESLLTAADAQGPFTGLIVDARSFDLRNCMSPRLLDAAFRDVYNGAHASADYVEDVGVVGYMGSVAAALKSARVGGRPLVVRAVGVGDAHKGCPVISLEDARRFLNDGGSAAVTTRCAVCFIIDSLAGRDGPPAAPGQ